MIQTVLFNCPMVGTRLFPVHPGPNGQPCIVGSSAETASTTSDSLFVFDPKGGRTKMHPYSEPGKALCEIHPGDFVGLYIVDLPLEVLMMSSFQIGVINEHVAHAMQSIMII